MAPLDGRCDVGSFETPLPSSGRLIAATVGTSSVAACDVRGVFWVIASSFFYRF